MQRSKESWGLVIASNCPEMSELSRITNESRERTVHAILLPALLGALILILFLALGCGKDNSSPTTATAPGDASATITGVERKPLTDEFLKDLAALRIGGANLVRAATITTQDADKAIDIKVSRPPTCHDGALVGISAVFVQKMMAQLYKYPEVAKVEIIVFGTSQDAPNDEVALRVMVDRASAQKIDWFQFNDRTMPALATEYYVFPAIQENYNLEGGDPSGPRSQTKTSTAAQE